jgi:hypothetical protein
MLIFQHDTHVVSGVRGLGMATELRLEASSSPSQNHLLLVSVEQREAGQDWS